MKQYLETHRCQGLQRATFSVSYDRDGAVVAVAWIEMRSAKDAQQLKEILDSPGTGSIRPLETRITLTGQHYDSDINGTLVTTAEAEPLAGSVAARLLKEAAAQAAG
ncbi:hypothetical protein [Actinomycetospora chiangmaiensis]|uniref:hypothetical protein n=1 Tax=Actinomycetospora chiangmaiensis TaxID=402650 RepID=UPI0012F91C3E|nr:hypothetical protein [Actinomycetospora chiangmaiensis]